MPPQADVLPPERDTERGYDWPLPAEGTSCRMCGTGRGGFSSRAFTFTPTSGRHGTGSGWASAAPPAASRSPASSHTQNELGAPRRQTRMAVRGIRGATTTEEDSETAIVDATIELLAEVARENALTPVDIAAAWFTTTPDLTAEFPAAAARRFGFGHVPLQRGPWRRRCVTYYEAYQCFEP